MKKILILLLFSIATSVCAQKLTYEDTCAQDEYHLYKTFYVEDTTVTLTLYKNQYIIKKRNKSSIQRVFHFMNDEIHIVADQNDICIGVYSDKGASYQLILWLRDVIYTVTIENGIPIKVTQTDERFSVSKT